MKTYTNILTGIAFVAIATISLALTSTPAFAQSSPKPNRIEGSWQGTLGAGTAKLRIALTISTSSDGKFAGKFESVDQGATLPMENITFDGASLRFELKVIGGVYQGTLTKDGSGINGTWTQTGVPAQPMNFAWTATIPASPFNPARPKIPLAELQPALDREMEPVLDHGVLAKSTGGGIVIGVYDHGQTKIFAYGTAQPDSMFEIGSVTKTFTGLVLAQMVEQKKVAFDDPVRTLLPDGAITKPLGAEITLLDLATQHSGLPRMPNNFHPANASDPYADYRPAQMYEFLARQGVERPKQTEFLYSNFGFGLLGQALSIRAGVPYEQLVKDEIMGPLHMNDTAITLSPSQQKRLIQGHDATNKPAGHWNFDALAGAGAIVSTAADMLKYLEANLHPEKITAAGSPASTLSAAVALDHEIRASGPANLKIALAWLCNGENHACFHDGATGGYSSYVFFLPGDDQAIVVLYNRDDVTTGKPFTERVFASVAGLLSGEKTPKLDQ